MAGFEYSPYPGYGISIVLMTWSLKCISLPLKIYNFVSCIYVSIAPVVSYAMGGQRRLRDLAPHESAARLHTLLHLAHQSLKFWDRNRAVMVCAYIWGCS